MEKTRKSTLAIIFIIVFILPGYAQEGMWMLTQLNQLDLSKKGLQIPVTSVYSKDKPSVSDAIVKLGGGTASFVSVDGLLITNHHVAYGAIQEVSSVKNDYLQNGFLAEKRSDEISVPGYQASLLLEMRDITAEVLDAIKGITDPAERNRKILEKEAELTAPYAKDKVDIEADAMPMFDGRQYMLFVHKIFKDVRLVYAPPVSIGNYGGEIDNWMWPRHTGDFSFMRVYCSPDGTGKEYSPENVPYHPKVWLKVAKNFLKDGDFNFIIGYPGSTTRYRSSTSVNFNEHYTFPVTVKSYSEIIEICSLYTKNNHEGQLKVANLVKGLANTMKNFQGKIDGMKKTHFYEKKLEFEKEFLKWANSKPETKAKYGDILEKEKEVYKLIEPTKLRDLAFENFQGLAGTPLNIAQQLIYYARERDKAEGGFSENSVDRAVDGLQYAYKDYFEPVDKALFRHALKTAGELPGEQRITGIEYVFTSSKPLDQFVDDAYKSTKLLDAGYTKSLFRKTTKELRELNDPFITMALNIDPMADEIQQINQKFTLNVSEARRVYLEGLFEWKGTGMYPDANRTKRFSWGKIRGYRPAEAVSYDPFTTLKGVIEKNTGEAPFNVPVELVNLYNKKDFGRWVNPATKEVPVAWLNMCDITGGNSGSPVLNAKGEICGLAFDGNYESMIGDWQYNPELQRCINVDIHYVLFITEKIGHAGFILKEMGIN